MAALAPVEATPVQLPNGQTKFAIRMDGVFSPEECAELIAYSEEKGHLPALINIGGGLQKFMPAIRSGFRCIDDNPELAAQIWARIEHAVPATRPTRQGGEARVAGLNERLRFLRYDPGQEFEAHFDGTYVRDESQGERAGERSMLTLLFYLNENYEAGCTRFIDTDDPQSVRGLDVEKATGMVMVHDHAILHSGSAPTAGTKYVIRTDVMYTVPEAERTIPPAPTEAVAGRTTDSGENLTPEEWNAREIAEALAYHERLAAAAAN